MVAAGEVQIGLELLEKRKILLPAPAGHAQLPPFLIIGRLAALRVHAVDRRAAADQPGLREGQGKPLDPGFGHQPRPVIFGPGEAAPAQVADPLGLPTGREIGAGLDQQHPRQRIFGQPRREYAARRPGPDDDMVELPLGAHPAFSPAGPVRLRLVAFLSGMINR